MASPSCPLCDADFSRPADKISYPQQCAVTATGIIWTRFSTVINPVSPAMSDSAKAHDVCSRLLKE